MYTATTDYEESLYSLQDINISAKSYVEIDKKKKTQGKKYEFAEFVANSKSLPERWEIGYITEQNARWRAKREGDGFEEIFTRVRVYVPRWAYTERHEIRTFMFVGLTKETDPLRRKLAFVQVYPSTTDISDGLYLLPVKQYLSGNEFLDTDNDNLRHISIDKDRIEYLKNKYDATTLLIINPRIDDITSNHADAGVYDYAYDYIIENSGNLATLADAAKTFMEAINER